MSKEAPKPKFVMLGKSKFVHVVRTKAADLRVKNGSGCQQVRKYQVANTVPKGKGLSVEAASALDPCQFCDTAAAIKPLLDPKAKAAAAKDARDDVMQRAKDSTKSKAELAKGKSKSKGKAAKPSSDKAKEPKAPKQTKSGPRATGDEKDKANQLVTFATEHGWKATIGDGKPGLVVTALKGSEAISCWFVDGKYDMARHAKVVVGSWEGKLRGAHQCRRQIAGEGRDRPYPNPGTGRSGPRKKDAEPEPAADESPEDAKRRVPFAMDDDDIVIMDAIRGKTIKWRNSMTNEVDSAWLPAEVKAKGKPTEKIQVVRHPKTERRMVTFMEVASIGEHGEVYGPWRTVYVDKIVRVVGS